LEKREMDVLIDFFFGVILVGFNKNREVVVQDENRLLCRQLVMVVLLSLEKNRVSALLGFVDVLKISWFVCIPAQAEGGKHSF